MCGNIKKLRFPDRRATAKEVDAAVLQFVRKISNVREPSAENQEPFDTACERISASVRKMLDGLKDRRAISLRNARFKRV